ncbi:MAG TPA: DUF444 family protein [Candidatus Polarisedimenticolaceae bacterium]|nr:DUF444 family protein [Candidatus Polarisedimenticolaceae bacterium]
MSRIQSDVNRFKQIVRGRVRDELRKHLGQQEMFGRQGKNIVSIPIPHLELPHFAHDPGAGKGVGQGDGDGDGRKAGNEAGQHLLEAEFSVEELAHMLGEALELPRIRPKGRDELDTNAGRYTGVSTVGPESLRHYKRSYRNALKRLIATGAYDRGRPSIVLERVDKRYRTWKPRQQPTANAVIVYVMDVSGSMGADQKELVRIASFWLDAWISSHYHGVRSVYVVHDAAAKEVDRDTFFRIRESGGTVISSAYELVVRILAERFPAEDWNLYLFHFSDGENYSRQDTEKCMQLLDKRLLPYLNLFGYGQVESYGTSGDFFEAVERHYPNDEKVTMAHIPDRDAIVGCIKTFLGKGR